MQPLLDIMEPGQTLAPHEEGPDDKQRVVGIDLGTTYSLVATIHEGKPTCIPDYDDRDALPSVVHYTEDGTVIVGEVAKSRQVSHPHQTVASVKRFMGRGVEEFAENQHAAADRLEKGDGGMVRIRVGDTRLVSPVEVSAEILIDLKERAMDALGGELLGAVITVPAYFDDAQRQATKDAARLAGLEVLRLVNEPTAAALAYGLDEGKEGIYAIYDLGGGTFDISLLKLTQGVFQVLSTGGNSQLGGDDFDHRLAELFLEEIGEENPTPSLLKAALQEARNVKERLSENSETTAAFDLPQGGSYSRVVSRNEFEGLIESLVKATGLPCRRALKDSKHSLDDLQGVVLVGGSTRVPRVRRFVKELFKREPLCDLDPDQVVAMGAAHQADLLAGNNRSDLLLLDVTPLSLGLETMGGLVEKIIPRNSTIPTARAQEFTTFKDGQGAMAIQVLQGERELVDECRSLARFELRGIPPMTAGAARIKVTFRVDADGLLTVSAREESTGVEQSVEVKPSYGLSDGEVERMLRDALEHSQDDVEARLLQEARVDSERVLSALGGAIKQDRDLLSDSELKRLKLNMGKLWEVSQESDHHKIMETIEWLDRETKEFAQRRMDRTVQSAMQGHSVSDFE